MGGWHYEPPAYATHYRESYYGGGSGSYYNSYSHEYATPQETDWFSVITGVLTLVVIVGAAVAIFCYIAE